MSLPAATTGPTYRFEPVAACNMCGASPDEFQVLGVRLNRSQGLRPRSVKGAGVTVVRCKACDLIFPDPQPVPTSIRDHYSMPGEDYWNDSRAEAVAPAHLVELFRQLRSLCTLREPIALDVGVGSGQAAKAMMAAGFEVHGFEPIPQFRDIALRTLGLPPGRVRLDGIETADYSDQSFDLVSFGAVLEHLYDPSAALEKAVRWLRPSGIIVLEVPSSKWLIGRLINYFFRLRGTNFVTHTSPMHSPFHLYEFGEASFRLNGQRAGYRVERVEYTVGVDASLPGIVQRLLRPPMRVSNTGMQMNLLLRKL
jgi:SAM-dependent methyltransferase